MPDIHNWMDIEADFEDGLLLGNGSSIALHDGFRYPSLHEEAVDRGFITRAIAQIFEQFGVSDFEEVLRKLWQTKLVLEALDLPSERIEAAYAEVRTALIATVRSAHIRPREAERHLPHIYRFMKRFKTVVSLNYDLIVYWAAMLGNHELELTWFKDGFQSGAFLDDWQPMRRPYKGAAGATMYFYPHGNLALKRTRSGEGKVNARQREGLLDSILLEWERGECVPLFVCEGTTIHKKKSIQSSSYLQRVLSEVIPDIRTSLVIYGWSMSEQDQHIIDQLHHSPPRRVAVSVRNGNQGYAVEAERILEAIGVREIVFFDAASAGCWNSPRPQRQ